MANQKTSKQVKPDIGDGNINGIHIEALQGTVNAIEQ